MRQFGHTVWVAAVIAPAISGCAPAWRPAMATVRLPARDALIDLTRYAPPETSAPLRYTVRRAGAPHESATFYERRPLPVGLTDGAMAAQTARPLAGYLGPEAPLADQRWKLWPGTAQQQQSGAAFFLEFDPPLTYLPPSIKVARGFEQQVRVLLYTRDGIAFRRGTVDRHVTFQGYETVEAGGVSYRDCVLLKVETLLRINWGPRVNITEYYWLAEGLGQVRRVERFSGFAFPLFFADTFTFERADPVAREARTVTAHPAPLRPWARCAVFLDRLLPRPHVGGMIVEYAQENAGPAIAAHDHSVSGLSPEG